jgi:hypothetical protein
MKMKILVCNSRRCFRKRYYVSIRPSGHVKVNCSTYNIVAFFSELGICIGFCHYPCACNLLLSVLLVLLKKYVRNIPVSYAPERHTHALKRTRTKTQLHRLFGI